MQTASRLKNVLYLAVILALLASFVGIGSVYAQPTQALTENWRSTDFNFNGKMLAVDINRNTYALGDSPATNVLNIRKYSPAGALLWQTTYDDPTYNLSGVWLALDNAGSVVALANIINSADGQPAGWMTLKYDTNGNQLWLNAMPRAASNAARVAVDMGGNIYVAGTGVLTKYSPTGATLWQDASGQAGQPYSMALSLDGARIALAGKSGITGLDFRASMYDSNGNRLWTNTTATPRPANDVIFFPNFDYNTYYASSTYLPTDPNPNQMAIAALDATGAPLWVNSYNVGDSAYRLAYNSGGIVATGVDSSGYLDWMTIKTDLNGNLLWSQRFDGAKTNDEVPNMLISANNSIYVTGVGGPNPSSGTISNLKGVVVKYSSSGVPQWAVWDDLANGKAIHIPDGLDFGMPVTVTTLGRGYLTATRYTETGLTDLAPAAPTNLAGSATSTDMSLTFSDNATNEFWVEVERCAGPGCTNFVKIGQTQGENAAAFRDSTVAGGTVYSYRVRAVGFMGTSAYSSTVSFIIPSAIPSAPSNLTAQAISRNQINLTWTNNSTNQTGIRVERCRGATCTNFTLVTTLPGSATAFSDTGLSKDTVYRYRVSATNSAGASPYSNIASARTLKR
jgi:hypothetical protein